MFLRHTTANENDVGAWERGHLGTDSIFRGDHLRITHYALRITYFLRRSCAPTKQP